MAYSKKISELPVRQQCNPTDIVPVVDAAETQTSSVTTAMIAALGGGRPGNDTIENACYKTNSITYPKLQATTGGNVLLGRISSDTTPSSGIIAEVPCSAWVAANVLPKTNQQDFVTAIGAGIAQGNALFTGAIRAANGTATQPSFGNTGASNTYGGTGIFFPTVTDGASTYTLGLGITVDGTEVFRIAEDGSLYSLVPGNDAAGLLSSYMVRAWARFAGSAAAGTTTTIYMNQRDVAARYGLTGTLRADATTRSHINYVEALNSSGRAAYFLNDSNVTGTSLAGTFQYNGVTYDKYLKGSTGRPNYLTTSDNFHWAWSGPDATGGWVRVAASSGNWIGGVVIKQTLTNFNPISGSGGVAAIQRLGLGEYKILFAIAMPDTQYTVVGSCSPNSTASGSIDPTDIQTTYCTIKTRTNAGVFDPSIINVAIVR